MESSSKAKTRYFSNFTYPYSTEWDAKTKNHVVFTLAGVHCSLANAIRRAMISKVSTLGFKNEPHKFSTIQIERNDTYLNNQIISHRLSMVPVNIPDVDKFDTEEYIFMLDVVNDTNTIKLVTTEDIKIKRVSSNTFLSDKETRDIFPVDVLSGQFIPLVKLKPKYYTNIGGHDKETEATIGKSIKIPVTDTIGIKFTAKLVRSNGDENGLFSPVTVSAYGYTIDKDRSAEAERAYVEEQISADTKLGLTPVSEEKLKRRFKINQIQRVYVKDESGEPASFDFRVESVGVIPPLICVERGIRWCIDSINKFIINIQTGNEKEVQVLPVPHLGNGFEIIVDGEDDTIGNLIQSWLTTEYADYSLEPDARLFESVTYHKTHPLEKRIVFTIKPISGTEYMSVVQGPVKKGCENLVKYLNTLLAELMETEQYLTELKSII